MHTDTAESQVDIQKLHKRLHHRLGEAIGTFHLINQGDKILIGLSGGKDSLALLHLLGERMKRSGGYFSLEALHVRMKGIDYSVDAKYLQTQAALWNIPLHIIEAEFTPDRNPKRTPCYLCARKRRSILFNEAQRLGCNKIALGHHRDDLLHTALMNLTFNGSFSTMPALLEMRKFKLTVIRPLALMDETDIKAFAGALNFKPLNKACPYEHSTSRTDITRVTEAMATLTPLYRANIWHALLKKGALVERHSEDIQEGE